MYPRNHPTPARRREAGAGNAIAALDRVATDGAASFLAEARRMGTASSAFLGRDGQPYPDAPKGSHLMAEADLELYRATDDASIWARAEPNGKAAYARWHTGVVGDLTGNELTRE